MSEECWSSSRGEGKALMRCICWWWEQGSSGEEEGQKHKPEPVLSKLTSTLKLLKSCVHDPSWLARVHSQGYTHRYLMQVTTRFKYNLSNFTREFFNSCCSIYLMRLAWNVCAHSWVDLHEPTCIVYMQLKSFFYAQIGERQEQKILNFKMELIVWDTNISNEELTITDFFVKKSDLGTVFKVVFICLLLL
jgi:hypothetical protein